MKAIPKYWAEKEWELDGVRVIEYLWPSDRPIVFARDVRAPAGVVERLGLPTQVCEGEFVCIPTFPARKGIEKNLRSAIRAQRQQCAGRPVVAHLVRVCGLPDEVAMLVGEGTHRPARLFFPIVGKRLT